MYILEIIVSAPDLLLLLIPLAWVIALFIWALSLPTMFICYLPMHLCRALTADSFASQFWQETCNLYQSWQNIGSKLDSFYEDYLNN